MHIAYPYQTAGNGRTKETGEDAHIRQMIEQVLFTVPGERVNRPDFGTGLLNLVFNPNSPELAAATEFTVQGALQQWLGEVIQVESVEVRSDESALRITVRYLMRRNRERFTAQFTREV